MYTYFAQLGELTKLAEPSLIISGPAPIVSTTVLRTPIAPKVPTDLISAGIVTVRPAISVIVFSVGTGAAAGEVAASDGLDDAALDAAALDGAELDGTALACDCDDSGAEDCETGLTPTSSSAVVWPQPANSMAHIISASTKGNNLTFILIFSFFISIFKC